MEVEVKYKYEQRSEYLFTVHENNASEKSYTTRTEMLRMLRMLRMLKKPDAM